MLWGDFDGAFGRRLNIGPLLPKHGDQGSKTHITPALGHEDRQTSGTL